MTIRKIVGATAIAVGLLSGASPAQAIPIFDPTGPARLVELARIVAELRRAWQTLQQINGQVTDFRNLQATMFPKGTLESIQTLFRSVRSLQDEMEQLSCGWKFSPRIARLRVGLFRKGPLCKDEYEQVFGATLPGLDSDLMQVRQWAAVRRLNTVAATVEASKQWTDAADSYSGQAKAANLSAGRAIRLTAGLSALDLQQRVRANVHQAEQLSAAQEDLDAAMREEWIRQTTALKLTQWSLDAAYQLSGQTPPPASGGGGQ